MQKTEFFHIKMCFILSLLFLFSIEKKIPHFVSFLHFPGLLRLRTHSEVLEAQGGDGASHQSNQHGPVRPDVHVSACSHCDSSSQGSVLNVNLWESKRLINGAVSSRFERSWAPLGVVYPTMSSFPLCSTKLETA